MTIAYPCSAIRRLASSRVGLIVAAAAALMVWASSAQAVAGANWKLVRSKAEWQARWSHAAVTHGGKIWILGGGIDTSLNSLHDVWYSNDGITWTQATAAAGWPARNSFRALSFGGKLWVLGGLQKASGSTIYSDVWNSTDGQNWVPITSVAQWGARLGHGAVVHGGKMFVLGGYNGSSDLHDVWSSTDGLNWNLVTAAAAWPARSNVAAIEYNNLIWVLGGYVVGSGTELHDVWSSPDGQIWTQVSTGAAWTARDSGAVEIYNGSLWMMGGYPTSADVWSSTNGSAWTLATGSADWPARFAHTALVVDNKLWIMGGVGNTTLRNDVWYTSTDASVLGRVTDAATNTVIGCAAIVAGSSALLSPRITTADINGDFRLDDMPTGTVTITTYAPGYGNHNATVILAEGERSIANFALVQTSQTGGVRGTVTENTLPHAPIPGIRVVAKIGGSPVATTFTCAEGRYEILGLAVKSTAVTVEFSGDAYITATQTVQVSSGSVVTADKSLAKSIPAPGALAGTVMRAGTSTPLVGARVTIEGLGDITTSTEPGGVYAFSSLPEGTYSVRASALGYGGQTQLSTVSSLGTTALDFALPLTPKGDIDQDSKVDAIDVQLVINAALSLPGPYNCDMSKDGVVDAVDVQQVINAALGL